VTVPRSDAAERINALDLLRFIAAMAVVLFHYSFRGQAIGGPLEMSYPDWSPYTRYGYLGVHLFFMISGFVILMTAAQGNLRQFVVSRLVRLYPAFWICCTISFVTLSLFGAGHYAPTFSQYLINLTLLSGFLAVPSIDGVYWSLFVEIKFYLLVALMLIAGVLSHVQRLLGLWLLVSLALMVVPVGILRSVLVTEYAAFFIAGATCYLIWSRGFTRERAFLLFATWVTALLQVVSELGEINGDEPMSSDPTTIAGIISTFYCLMLLIALRRTGPFGARRWLRLGALTYPLYLLHQNVGYLMLNAGYPAFSPLQLLIATVAMMLLLSYLIHTRWERLLATALKSALVGRRPATGPDLPRASHQSDSGVPSAPLTQESS
jgi:peptidoglycan/LPS O-acetylase OafA/YrhL